MNIKWDAEKYTKDFSFVHQFGGSVMELLNIEQDMTVLDLGCGNGALTKKLSELCGRAVGLDDSAELLEIARKNYPELQFVKADATDFELGERVDAVFSNAVFHWIDEKKQRPMLNCINRQLKHGGQLVFEFGGYGNNVLIHSALSEAFEKRGYRYVMPFYFPTIGEYAGLLEQSGFKVTFMTLFDRPTRLSGENGLEDWIRMFVRSPFEGIGSAEKDEMIHTAVQSLKGELYREGAWCADYVRIRGKALKDREI
ncbi:MAG: class I SAM-dependent methyltransferase [Oscillospiraceae bacterium]